MSGSTSLANQIWKEPLLALGPTADAACLFDKLTDPNFRDFTTEILPKARTTKLLLELNQLNEVFVLA